MADVKDLFKQALKLTQEGKLDKAIESYQAIVKKTPKDTRVLNNLGDLYLRKKMTDEAGNIFSALAQLYEDDGYTLRAIAICQKVLKLNAEAAKVRHKMAELYARQGLVAEAKNQYLELANHYDKKGQVRDALEIFRKLADLDPQNLSVRAKLGNMFQKEGMPQKATAEWIKAAEGYLKGGQASDAVELLVRAVAAEPGNLRARVLLAGEEIKKDRTEKVLELLRRAVEDGSADLEALKLYAAALLKTQLYAEAVEILRKALEKDPASLPIKENLGLALLKSGHYQAASEDLLKVISQHAKEGKWDRAEKLSRELKQVNPEDAQVLQKLVDIYTHTGDRISLKGCYRDLAALYEKRGLKKNVLGIYEKLAEIDPEGAEWREKIRELKGAPEGRPAEASRREPPRPAAPVVEKGAEELPEEDLGLMAASGEEVLEMEVSLEMATAATPMEAVERLLANGLFKEAASRLLEMIKRKPTVETYRVLKKAYLLDGMIKSYIGCCFSLAGILMGEGKKKETIREYQDILRADKSNQKAKEALADLVLEIGLDLGVEEAPVEEAVAPEKVEEEFQIPEVELEEAGDVDLESLAGEIAIELEAPPAAAPPRAKPTAPPAAPKAAPGPPAAAQAPPAAAPPKVEAPVPAAPPQAKPAAPAPPPTVPKAAPVAAAQAPPAAAPPKVEAAPVATPPRVRPPAPPPFAKEAPLAAEDVDEQVAEADFYRQQGLYTEAEKAYKQILTSHPERLDVASRLGEIADQAKGDEEETPQFTMGDEDLEDFERSMDLGLPQPKQEMKFSVAADTGKQKAVDRTLDFDDFVSGLREEVEESARPPAPKKEEESFREIFQEFQKGVREQLSQEDFETHYNLGIAYKEMGLLDEAVSEFELSVKSPKHYIDSVSMIALCHKDRGEMDEAVSVISRALDQLAPDDEGRKGLLWAMGGVLEEMGEKQRAVDTYLAVYEMDEAYRDIKDKLKDLGALRNRETKKPSGPERKPEGKPETPAQEPRKKSTRVSYI